MPSAGPAPDIAALVSRHRLAQVSCRRWAFDVPSEDVVKFVALLADGAAATPDPEWVRARVDEYVAEALGGSLAAIAPAVPGLPPRVAAELLALAWAGHWRARRRGHVRGRGPRTGRPRPTARPRQATHPRRAVRPRRPRRTAWGRPADHPDVVRECGAAVADTYALALDRVTALRRGKSKDGTRAVAIRVARDWWQGGTSG